MNTPDNQKPEDKLQKINVPLYIKYLSVIYIITSIVAGIFSFLADIVQGEISIRHIAYIPNILGNVVTGFLFWGIGQVFSKFMEKK
ncbi:hypothetical protein H0R92_11425 [Treponema sp. OMZ 840]|uniref:hypothetical protein n=1 Tax=Treponema sp. OMZ 840 TaxID=244313 RepID=UPI003D8C81BB